MRTAGAIVLVFALFAPAAGAEEASAGPTIPPPDFETDYTQPPLSPQTRDTHTREVAAAVLLVAALAIATWLLLYRRSRTGIFVLGIFAVGYFGFYKTGCICPVGSVQNVALALSDPAYAIPLVAVVAFLAPLFFAMVFGRVFCGSVCALGALQDVFLFEPLSKRVRVPRWLDRALGLVRWFILGITVYLVASTGEFHLCRLDPLVGFFRMSGPAWIMLTGTGILVLATFVGRPYCRYLCPYSALLSVFARWPTKGVSITPDDCITCTLCEDACPFGAILAPAPEYRARRGMTALAWSAAAAFVLVLGAAGYFVTGRTMGGALLGVFLGLVVGTRLVSLTRSRKRTEYEVNHSSCLSCGRCYKSCPRERKRLGARGLGAPQKVPTGAAGEGGHHDDEA